MHQSTAANKRAQNLEHASRPHCSPRITVCCMIGGDAKWERDLAEVSKFHCMFAAC